MRWSHITICADSSLGSFYRHPFMAKYDFYWRVEPDVGFWCNLDYDPIKWIKDNKKKYGFTIALTEYENTIPSLWKRTKKFIRDNPSFIPEENSLKIVTREDGSYNLCHFWSNFEIADMSLWRSDSYSRYFKYLDEAGGFFLERWGDAPVHSIGAAMLCRPDEIHWFQDIGYTHAPYTNCPNECNCDQTNSTYNFCYEELINLQ